MDFHRVSPCAKLFHPFRVLRYRQEGEEVGNCLFSISNISDKNKLYFECLTKTPHTPYLIPHTFPMQILSSKQIHDWDTFTMLEQNISSLELMERAVSKCFDWLKSRNYVGREFFIFCGKGNNGGNALVLARKLYAVHCPVQIVSETGQKASTEFQSNLAALQEENTEINFIKAAADFSG